MAGARSAGAGGAASDAASPRGRPPDAGARGESVWSGLGASRVGTGAAASGRAVRSAFRASRSGAPAGAAPPVRAASPTGVSGASRRRAFVGRASPGGTVRGAGRPGEPSLCTADRAGSARGASRVRRLDRPGPLPLRGDQAGPSRAHWARPVGGRARRDALGVQARPEGAAGASVDGPARSGYRRGRRRGPCVRRARVAGRRASGSVRRSGRAEGSAGGGGPAGERRLGSGTEPVGDAAWAPGPDEAWRRAPAR